MSMRTSYLDFSEKLCQHVLQAKLRRKCCTSTHFWIIYYEVVTKSVKCQWTGISLTRNIYFHAIISSYRDDEFLLKFLVNI